MRNDLVTEADTGSPIAFLCISIPTSTPHQHPHHIAHRQSHHLSLQRLFMDITITSIPKPPIPIAIFQESINPKNTYAPSQPSQNKIINWRGDHRSILKSYPIPHAGAATNADPDHLL